MKLIEVWDYTARVESFYIKDGVATSFRTAPRKPDDLSARVFRDVHTLFVLTRDKNLRPEVFSSWVGQAVQIFVPYDASVGRPPAINVYPGNGGSIADARLSDEHVHSVMVFPPSATTPQAGRWTWPPGHP